MKHLAGLSPADLACCDGASSFLQSGFWGSFKARFGWSARAFKADFGAWGIIPLLVIRRRLGPFFSFAYVPWGPELPEDFPAGDRGNAAAELALALKDLLPKDTAFIRFDPPWPVSVPAALPFPFTRSGADVQPPDTVLVNLEQGMDAVLAGMKSKWRYNARLALKKGVLAEEAGREGGPPLEQGLDDFYYLLRETARRDGIAIHESAYYKTLFSHSAEYSGGQKVRLYLARHEGELLAGIVTLCRKEEAVYLYGASSNVKRNLMAPYALQVKAMEDAAASGAKFYDLFGIPPTDDPSHPMAGLYLFKTGFGGEILHRPGSWDYPYKPAIYHSFRLAEKTRKSLRTIKKRLKRAGRE